MGPVRYVHPLEPEIALSTSPFSRRSFGMAARTEGRQTVATAVSTNSACSLDNYLVLPAHSCAARFRAAREILGEQCVVLGHHYQRDEVIQFSDYQGDSWRLSELASQAK